MKPLPSLPYALIQQALLIRCSGDRTKSAIARFIFGAECLYSVLRGITIEDCAIDSQGCANLTKDRTRPLKPIVHKLSSAKAESRSSIKARFGIKSHINNLSFRSFIKDD
ncbi:hypothetical protein [Microcoleus sp. bin38.metabat.b11b12b14.051]|uniref:hypothetical protein n=1 Tax=Microcoleus sp. bin38.metabat.b11b12b14.051 TaxID=2742709 RepID=UPI0025E8DDA3|nr:hypothetical protein [Microcoleus sp. bin38.metabat.b11b12b14.051]